MARFGPFHLKFSSNLQKNSTINTFVNHKTHLYPLTIFLIRFFFHYFYKVVFPYSSIQTHTNSIHDFHTIVSIPLLFLIFFFLLPSFSSILLLFSLLFTEFALSFKTKNEIFCLSLIRPCLALYNFVLLFGFLLLGPLTPLYLQIILFIFPL